MDSEKGVHHTESLATRGFSDRYRRPGPGTAGPSRSAGTGQLSLRLYKHLGNRNGNPGPERGGLELESRLHKFTLVFRPSLSAWVISLCFGFDMACQKTRDWRNQSCGVKDVRTAGFSTAGFFYDNALSFNAADSPSLAAVSKECLQFGQQRACASCAAGYTCLVLSVKETGLPLGSFCPAVRPMMLYMVASLL